MAWVRGKRSSFLVLIVSLIAAESLAVCASAQAATARPADSFVESMGVNVHTAYTDTPYFSQFETVKERLEELGVRHVRDELQPSRPDQYQALNALASAGIKSTLILGSPRSGTSVLDNELVPALKEKLSGAVDAVEGPNEYSTSGDPNGNRT